MHKVTVSHQPTQILLLQCEPLRVERHEGQQAVQLEVLLVERLQRLRLLHKVLPTMYLEGQLQPILSLPTIHQMELSNLLQHQWLQEIVKVPVLFHDLIVVLVHQ